ncbi:SusC/RagA family TonB-linked outer membrane protein [Parasegetibacter sp. NRK P23]|uniref:SusC/RagA family TonB-linked outer membrane protein n=1 Tax=Parasegetibacter sp. NRK P23 TaxID=2942999 RepID=UPI0020447183|nr:SusC/RagA family TonB-linked outer membrane protein [Parasegetibacter sp. NRK P23]MCM5528407.1 SusC/RagA family TonB-linked outer membrane protein [Parasegetibacter sp. NRK P23]
MLRLLTMLCASKKASVPFIFLLTPFLLFAQATKKGKVVDDKGQGVPGITISVKGTGSSTASKEDGTFTIAAKTGDVLVFSGISYETKEVPVTSQETYNVTITTAAATLGDLVVIGYGKGSKKTLTSAITTVRPEDMNRGAIADVGQLLQGKVPGLNITASGDPNRPAAVILRGASTINSPGGPFYVIDGVPGADISIVAPDDIATIDVLKDAAATAIYGNRAANGVIMITTKRGKKGAVQTVYNGYVGLEKVSSRLDLMDAAQHRAFLAANNSAYNPIDDQGADTDWQKAIQRNGAVAHNHNISFSGGGEHSTYSASLNYLDKEGILLKSRLRRMIARLSVEQYALKDKVKFSLNVANSRSTGNYTPLQNVALLQAAKHLPVNNVKNPDGTYFENLTIPGYFNPVAIIDNAQDDTKYNALTANFSTEVKLPFGFTYNTSVSYQTTNALNGQYYGSYYGRYPTSGFYNNPDPGIGIAHVLIGSLFGVNGSAFRSSYENSFTTLESFLNWNRKFGDHNINAVIGYAYQQNVNGDGFRSSSTNFLNDFVGYQNLALGNPYAISNYRIDAGPTGVYSKTRLISDFGRLNYDYQGKYILQASLRRDGSSVFGANNRWGYFPSGSIAWRVVNENFMQNQQLFDDLKFRVSYGVTGNSAGIGAYNSQLIYGLRGTYYNGGVFDNAIVPAQANNPDLKWEELSTFNAGIDFSIINRRVTGSLDWYKKQTTNMLFGVNASASIVPGGYIIVNGGKLENQGVEFSLTAAVVEQKDFKWTSILNLAHNKNNIVNLDNIYTNADSLRYTSPEGAGQSGSTLQILKTGYPIGQFFTLNYAGKDENGISQFYKKDGSKTSGTQMPLTDDYIYAGNAQPKLLIGWNNNLSYKNFDLNFFFRSALGQKIFNATRADLSYVTAASVNNLLVSANEDKSVDNRNSFYSNRYIESGNYVRLDNATLAYTFRKPVEGVNSLRVYVTGNNLLTITNYSGIDPEINQGGIAPGIDYNNFFPRTRTILFGVNVAF